jgi:hypothetical protein
MPKKRSTPKERASRKPARRKLLLESIEDRILCSATVDPAAARA